MKKLVIFIVFMTLAFVPCVASSEPRVFSGGGGAGGNSSITMNDDVQLIFGTAGGVQMSIEMDGTTDELYIKTDTTSRNIVITDGDEPALSNSSDPTLRIYDASGSYYVSINRVALIGNNTYTFSASYGLINKFTLDKVSGNAFSFVSDAGDELTDDNAEQAWLYIEPKINQASAGGANYVGLLMDVTETATDSGVNELMALRVATVDKFTVDNEGAATIGTVTFHSGTTTFSTAQINASRADPRWIVPPQGANTWIELVSAVIVYDYATAAFTVGADEDFIIEYADGTDTTASIETTGFLDQADDELRLYPTSLAAAADIEATVNQGLRFFNTGAGETADGGGEVDVRYVYRVYTTGL